MQDRRLPEPREHSNDLWFTEKTLSLLTGRGTVASQERLCI